MIASRRYAVSVPDGDDRQAQRERDEDDEEDGAAKGRMGSLVRNVIASRLADGDTRPTFLRKSFALLHRSGYSRAGLPRQNGAVAGLLISPPQVVAQFKTSQCVVAKPRAFTSGARDLARSCTIGWNQGASALRQILRKLRMTQSTGRDFQL
jgi:hypothetical protein